MVFQTIEFDPMCDKENPHKIYFEDVSAAAFRIQRGIVKTPCVVSLFLNVCYFLLLFFFYEIYIAIDNIFVPIVADSCFGFKKLNFLFISDHISKKKTLKSYFNMRVTYNIHNLISEISYVFDIRNGYISEK